MWITCDVFISCLDSHSDGTHSLQSIHCWESDGKLHFSKSDEETNSPTGWPEGEDISIFGWTSPLICIISAFRHPALKKSISEINIKIEYQYTKHNEDKWDFHSILNIMLHNIHLKCTPNIKQNWLLFIDRTFTVGTSRNEHLLIGQAGVVNGWCDNLIVREIGWLISLVYR